LATPLVSDGRHSHGSLFEQLESSAQVSYEQPVTHAKGGGVRQRPLVPAVHSESRRQSVMPLSREHESPGARTDPRATGHGLLPTRCRIGMREAPVSCMESVEGSSNPASTSDAGNDA
jgi:hypothetical protein